MPRPDPRITTNPITAVAGAARIKPPSVSVNMPSSVITVEVGGRSEEHTSELQSLAYLLSPPCFVNARAPAESSPLPLHAPLPICCRRGGEDQAAEREREHAEQRDHGRGRR